MVGTGFEPGCNSWMVQFSQGSLDGQAYSFGIAAPLPLDIMRGNVFVFI